MTPSRNRKRAARNGTLGEFRRSLQGSGDSQNHRTRVGSWRALSGLLVVAVVGLVISVSVGIRVMRQANDPPAAGSEERARPLTSDEAWDDRWPVLTMAGFPARSPEEIKAAYGFAARRPDVLTSVPCFCGCKRQGHESNEACYVQSRSSSGTPRWSNHAITCGICIDITRDAAVMTADGQPVPAIRKAIETKYRDR